MTLVGMLRVTLPAVVLCALDSAVLRAGIIPVSQERSVSLRVLPNFPPRPPCDTSDCNFEEERTASGFGAFNESISFSGHGTARQTSSISPFLVRAVGFTEADQRRPNTRVDAVSNFDLIFDVASTETWRLIVNISDCPVCGAFALGADFSLVGPGVSIVVDSADFPVNMDRLVTLTAGSYRLRSRIRVAADPEEAGSLAYDMTFQSTQAIPEPGSAFLMIAGALVIIGSRALRRTGAPGQ